MKGAKTDDGTFIAPSLMGSARVNGDKQTLSKIILNGLIGPIDGKEYGIMLPLKDNSDNYIADVLGYVRALNESSLVSRHEVRNARKQTKDTRDAYWTLEEQLKKEESKLRLD